ncbi:MAG: GNAT family N-acetyltransferase [Clostridia bacterium]|nr:GNAT family N-acetyltransferase [Clostridia bacterium]
MICLSETLDEIKILCENSPFGCPIISAAEAYGLEQPFARFWTDGSAAYSMLDGVMRISGKITDAEEVSAFLYAVGAEQVVCDLETAEVLGLHITDRGAVLYKDLPTSCAVPREEVSVRQVYDVLHECDMVGEFEPFYLDVSHRTRHKTALCTAMYSESEMTAAAVSVFGANCTLITAVGVRSAYRRRGLGSAVVRKTEEYLSGRVYLFRAENENERFYASLGYTPCGTWCAGTLK